MLSKKCFGLEACFSPKSVFEKIHIFFFRTLGGGDSRNSWDSPFQPPFTVC